MQLVIVGVMEPESLQPVNASSFQNSLTGGLPSSSYQNSLPGIGCCWFFSEPNARHVVVLVERVVLRKFQEVILLG